MFCDFVHWTTRIRAKTLASGIGHRVFVVNCRVYLRLLDHMIVPKGYFNLLGYSTHCLKVLD